MKSSDTLKHFFLAFVIAVIVYVVSYYGIEHRRTRTGPWQVAFTNEASVPTLIVNQSKLKIANLRITFPGETNSPTGAFMDFDQPQEVPFDVPFGQCLFEDTTFLPGTIVFKLFGHEIQLLPRVLTIDRREYPWQSGAVIAVNKANTSPGAR